jgi:hypothetical protein
MRTLTETDAPMRYCLFETAAGRVVGEASG